MEWGNGHQRYEQIQEIGVGAYGTVYRKFAKCPFFEAQVVIFEKMLPVKTINVSKIKRARDRENDGQIVALKRLRVQARF